MMSSRYLRIAGIVFFLFVWITACGNSENNSVSDGDSGTISIFKVAKYPVDLAVDSGDNIWVACQEGKAVIKVQPDGKIETTYNMQNKPMAIAIDSSGKVWIPLNNGDVVRIDPESGEMETRAHLSSAVAIALDSNDNLWVGTNNGVQRLKEDGTVLASADIGGTPHSIAVDGNNNLWILVSVMDQETGNISDKIIKVASDGSVVLSINNPTRAWDIAINLDGNPVLYDVHGPGLAILDSEGNVIAEQNTGAEVGAGSMPRGIAIAENGVIWVVDSSATRAVAADLSSVITSIKHPATANGISMTPRSIAIDSRGNIWLAMANTWVATEDVEENTSLVRIKAVAQGPQYFPVEGPIWP